MTQEAYARLIGILYTDGCVSPKGSSWRIIVSNNSIAVVDCFAESVTLCFEESIRRMRRGKLHVGVLDSKRIGQMLVDRHGTFRTEACRSCQGCPFLRGGRMPCLRCEPVDHQGIAYPPASLPSFSTVGEVRAFLQAAFSCDGGVNLYVARRGALRWLIRNVYLACKHPNLIHQYSALLSALGVGNRVMAKDWRVLVQGRCALDRYRELIGFMPNVAVSANSRYWQGTDKSQVLRLLLDSYGNPHSITDHPMFSL